MLTPGPPSEGARKGVQVRSARPKVNAAKPASAVVDTSKALHLCLKRIKEAESQSELRRLTEELQRIVFHTQYMNAEN
jgi:hypothetical protein